LSNKNTVEYSISGILNRAIRQLQENLLPLVKISLAIALPLNLIFNLILAYLNPAQTGKGAMQMIISAAENQELSAITKDLASSTITTQILQLVYAVIFYLLIMPITDAAICKMIHILKTGKTITYKRSLKWALNKYAEVLLSLLVLALVYTIIFLSLAAIVLASVYIIDNFGQSLQGLQGMSIFFLVMMVSFFVIYLACRLWLFFPVVIVEEIYFFAAVKRSMALTKGNVSKIFWLYTLLGITNTMLMSIPYFTPVIFLSVILICVTIMLNNTFYHTVMMNTYYACRNNLENYDIHELTRLAFEKVEEQKKEDESENTINYAERPNNA